MSWRYTFPPLQLQPFSHYFPQFISQPLQEFHVFHLYMSIYFHTLFYTYPKQLRYFQPFNFLLTFLLLLAIQKSFISQLTSYTFSFGITLFNIASTVSSANSALLQQWHSAFSIHTHFLQEMLFLVIIIILDSSTVFRSVSPSTYFVLFKQFIYQNVQLLLEIIGCIQLFNNINTF